MTNILPIALAGALLVGGTARAQCLQSEVGADDAALRQAFGGGLAAEGRRLFVSGYGDDVRGETAGAISVLERDGSNWFVVDRIPLPEVGAFLRPGIRLATRGSLLATCTPAHWDHVSPVYVFEQTSDGWEPTLLPSRGASSSFPSSLVVGDDLVAVGYSRDDELGHDAGAVHLHVRDASGWVFAGKLGPPEPAGAPHFGMALAYDDGRLAVSATGDDELGDGAGAVYLFERDGTGWHPAQRLTAGDAAEGAFFGASLALDGGTLVVGATGADHRLRDTGAVYVFEDGPGGFVQKQKLVADDLGAFARLGRDVALAGSFLVASTWPRAPGPTLLFARAAGEWSEVGRISPDPAKVAERATGWSLELGSEVLLTDEHIVVSAAVRERGQERAGSARVYSLRGDDCASLRSDGPVSAGRQTLTLDRGAASAGRAYVLLGSSSGTSPGFLVDGVRLPLQPDGYLAATVTSPWGGLLDQPLGVLDAAGRATVVLDVPPAFETVLADVRLDHAFVELGPGGVTHISNAVSVWFWPAPRH